MTDDDPTPDDELLCYCVRITRERVLQAIREEGARSVEDVRRLTLACTGCNSCYWDIETLLKEEGITPTS